jgi:hypothetical protein
MQQLVDDIAEAIRQIDGCGVPFKSFRPGAGPYGEPQLTKLLASQLLQQHPERYVGARTCRAPDVLVPGRWALEFKIVRPFGDNGIEAEHWSQNLLHPYRGNVSAIADAYKLLDHTGDERRGLIVIGYEHEPPRIEVGTLISAFELLCRQLLELPLGERYTAIVDKCVHPVHQRATIFGWCLGEPG